MTLSTSLAGLVAQVTNESVPTTKKVIKSKTTAKQKVAKAIVKAVKVEKPKLPAFVVFYREDRKKWIATNAQGQQEAARKTEVAAYNFLMKKYNKKGTALKV